MLPNFLHFNVFFSKQEVHITRKTFGLRKNRSARRTLARVEPRQNPIKVIVKTEATAFHKQFS